MKKYIKPTVEFIELRPEERIAHCNMTRTNSSCHVTGSSSGSSDNTWTS